MIYLFSDKGAAVSEVGGKAYSLIKMTEDGFNVPPGMVLGARFFENWIDALDERTELRIVSSDSDEVIKHKVDSLRKTAQELKLTEQQKKQIDEKLEKLPAGISLFSVRSSSPEEDMEGASFAGMYETCLGVKPADLEESIRRVFMSAIDFRVIAYKRKNGFDFTRFSIAVIIMKQIKSEAAGVGFSINPLNNCFDEAVVNANFGVGESVVSGDTVPDLYVIDKVKERIISRKTGDKQLSTVIGENGGTATITRERTDQAALSDEQILQLAEVMKKVEKHYNGAPMDIEWAVEGGELYLVQARPITTYIPLHPAFLTEPGDPKILYLDLTLVEQGIQKPLSIMGTDCFGIFTNCMGISATGENIAKTPEDLVYAAGGRAYVNLSKCILLEGQKQAAKDYEGLDSYAAQVIRDSDVSEYKTSLTFGEIMKTAKIVFKGVFKSYDVITGILKGKNHPEALRRMIDDKVKEFFVENDTLDPEEMSFTDFVNQGFREVADLMVHTTISSLIDSEQAKESIKKLFSNNEDEWIQSQVDKLDRGLPHNVTIDMSCRIYELMTMLDKKEFHSLTALEGKIRERKAGEAFLAKWDEFIAKYGFRGPGEIDIRTPRYEDDFSILLKQMKNFALLDKEDSPQEILKRQVEEREKAYESLMKTVENKKQFQKIYEVLINLGGYREIHKYFLVYFGAKVRKKALEIAEAFLSDGRIDKKEDILNLSISEIEEAMRNKALNIRDMIAENMKYMSKVEHITTFPPVIDSRGKILRPERKSLKPGEFAGDPVSAGIVSGKVNIVSFAGEKEISRGDILVAKAADPGWTPLFINASGILLEVGGLLQHGSLIAREYGKPCIAGIENVTSMLKDGELIEMNGATGIIRKLEKL